MHLLVRCTLYMANRSFNDSASYNAERLEVWKFLFQFSNSKFQFLFCGCPVEIESFWLTVPAATYPALSVVVVAVTGLSCYSLDMLHVL